ncbi:hypothetical protein C7T94_18895 [Pedobacter yulinensis]|uniref:Transcriptional regulator n=1 Tax=Pedobacter yulinensis TaxID=2126353 RepID=A0A2T3HGY1_9SPHI|nr:PadR family transcriptional regulator [Pedobacter yulinensis]PST81682.1 hypothetical protein C7T94_18895 [Pedobacter yulinensis]
MRLPHPFHSLLADQQPSQKNRPGNFELFALLKIILKNPKRDQSWLQKHTETDLGLCLGRLEEARLIRVHEQPLTGGPTAPTYSITPAGVRELALFMFPAARR